MNTEVIEGFRSLLLSERHLTMPDEERKYEKTMCLEAVRQALKGYKGDAPTDATQKRIYNAQIKPIIEACEAFLKEFGE